MTSKVDRQRKIFEDEEARCFLFGCNGKLKYLTRSPTKKKVSYYFVCEKCGCDHRSDVSLEFYHLLQEQIKESE